MGYSQRYLAMKFDRFVGLGPKTLAEVVRFQNRFVALTRFGSAGGAADFDEDYYDQSHFSREFKRFAGLHGPAYLRTTNQFLSMRSTAASRAPPRRTRRRHRPGRDDTWQAFFQADSAPDDVPGDE